MKKDICYGIILFFIIRSILGFTELIGYEIIVNFVHNIYIAPSLLAIVAFTLLVTCFRVKKLPYIRFWIIPLLSAYLNYSKELIEIYSEVERALLFSLMTGIREISLILLVIIAYVKYYRLK